MKLTKTGVPAKKTGPKPRIPFKAPKLKDVQAGPVVKATAKRSVTARGAIARSTKLKRKPSKLIDLEHLDLTPKQVAYVKAKAAGRNNKDAAIEAGYSPNSAQHTAKELEKMPPILAALGSERKLNATYLKFTREDMLDGLKEAIDMARVQALPDVMIMGWKEIGKVCGFYEPERHVLHLSASSKQFLERIQALPDDELLRLAEGQVIDGQFTEVLDAEA